MFTIFSIDEKAVITFSVKSTVPIRFTSNVSRSLPTSKTNSSHSSTFIPALFTKTSISFPKVFTATIAPAILFESDKSN